MSRHPRPPAPLRWFAIFDDDPTAAVEVAPPGDLLARFDIAANLGHYERRPVTAMWIVDDATGQVLRVHGAVPRVIAKQHSTGPSKKPHAPSLSLQQISPRRPRPF